MPENLPQFHKSVNFVNQSRPPDLALDLEAMPFQRSRMTKITDNTARSRFELEEDGMLAFADYHLEGNLLALPHVEADPALRGKGAAGRLMEGVLGKAREQGWKVRPLCGYAADYIQRHGEFHDLRA
jgi:uncharacterized protein